MRSPLIALSGVAFLALRTAYGQHVHNHTSNNASLSAEESPDHNHDSHAHSPMPMPDFHNQDHAHSDSGPLTVLNETEILQWHLPDPPSYYDFDFGSVQQVEGKSWGGFMAVHVVAMSLAYFGVLPLAIALRGAKHPLHGLFNVMFLLLTAVGAISGTAYKKLTPDLYEASAHRSMGYILLTLTQILSIFDLLPILRRAWTFARSSGKSLPRLWSFVLLGRQDAYAAYDLIRHAEEYNLENKDEQEHFIAHEFVDDHTIPEGDHWDDGADAPLPSPAGRTSLGSDDHSETTLHDPHSPLRQHFQQVQAKQSWLSFLSRAVFHVTEHALVVFAFIVVVDGMVTYTGICRESYVNGCLAHFIKGGIFLFYGILTFARYCGAFSQIGWAWNRVATPPNRSPPPTAEMIESFVVFFYGATNTWMERFGSQPGDPYSTKQIQHISIAVMFWFAGLTGMALESQFVRSMLSQPALRAAGRPEREVAQPPSYRGSFNVFPAICIGITGAAMSAHHQEYLFQVQIHALWGVLLSAFAFFRCFTYFFLWLRPPTSTLPSRPPTEAIASFCLAAGGLTFMLSTEQITFAAMRQGKDDMMMFLNLAVGVICLVFTWVLAVLAFRGWAVSRVSKAEEAKKLPPTPA